MTLIWPQALLLLVLVPLGILAWRWIDRRQRQKVAAFGQLGGSAAVAASGASSPGSARFGRFRRRLPAFLYIVGITVLVFALARPQGTVDLPREEGTVILAFDVSGSMAATDLQPTRMAAAKAAAIDFVQRQPSSVVIGVVAFSDSGISVQQPSNDQDTVVAAINRLTPQKGTSVGQGIAASLKAIQVQLAGPTVNYYSNKSPAPTASPTPVPAGYHAPAVIVLLTDGENNENPDPVTVAQTAANQGVRIYTVGIGSAAGTNLDLNGFQVHTQLDAATLQQIAQVTGGTYYAADDAASLKSIYDNLDTQLIVKAENIELTALFAGAGILFLVLGGALSLVWLGRLP
jgi:Ca-activated chloride channel family protein